MNANVNNSVNANNSNINAMNVNEMEFVCSQCGSKHIVAQPRTSVPQPWYLQNAKVKVMNDLAYIQGGVTDMIIAGENDLLMALAQNIDKLPEKVLTALKGTDVYESIIQVATAIEQEGYIESPQIVRRFLVSQALKLVYGEGNCDMSRFLREGGWSYTIKVLNNELNAMAHMEKNKDFEALDECKMIWTDKVFIEVMEHCTKELIKDRNNDRLIHRCKGRKYVKINHKSYNNGKGIYLDEWKDFIDNFYRIIDQFKQAKDYFEKDLVFSQFVRGCRNMRWSAYQCDSFNNAFKAAGGYYTLKNLILFEGVKLTDNPSADQLEILKSKFEECCGKDGEYVTRYGYKVFGYLKKVLEVSKFDFEATKKKWYEASQARKETRRNHERRSRN